MHDALPGIEALSETLLLIRIGHDIDIEVNARVHALARRIGEAALPGVLDLSPAYASLGLRYAPSSWTRPGVDAFEAISQALRPLLRASAEDGSGLPRRVDIPVCYGGACGADLPALAEACALSVDDVIRRHSTARYRVAMLGFAPGFPYLLGLDSALHLPRRAVPRTSVPAGSVAIGGAQTGIYPRDMPGGWHLIGRTPLSLFDVDAARPCRLTPGDEVRFVPITATAFGAWPGECE